MLQSAAVFFARDFLSLEFPKMKAAFADLSRVYIVMNPAEAENIRVQDPEGEVILIGAAPVSSGALALDDADAINRDRFLRLATAEEIAATRRSIAAVCDHVLARYRPIFYLDEPVSGYANEMFSRSFGEAGALCLHFQIAWLPGYCFFVSDAAQAIPVRLDMLSGSEDAVRRHVELRAAGLARPTYVIAYGKVLPRIRDIFVTLGKAVYRKLFRRNAAYIDREVGPHLFHARSLWKSLFGRYSPDPVAHAADTRYVVFPLHYEPEALLAYFSRFYRQEEIASQILDSLPPGFKLVLKEHPSQPGALQLPKWADLRASKRVVILRGDYQAARLMQLRPAVVSLGSTFSLEAALAGCPVAVIGGVHFQDAPGVTRIDRPGDWPRILDAPTASAEDLTKWYADFLDRYCFGGNIMRGKTRFDDLPHLAEALRARLQAN